MSRVLFAISLILLAGCYRAEPEGPAEQIGKGIDQIAKGMNSIPNDPNYAGDSHTRDSYNTQGSANENYRADDYWAKSDDYWKEHDPKKKFEQDEKYKPKPEDNHY